MTSPSVVRNTTRSPLRAAELGRDDQDIPVAIERLHTVAGHFQRIGVLVVNAGEADLIPAAAYGKAAVVEEAAGASLGQADERDGLRGFAQARARLEQVDEFIKRGAGGGEHLGEALSGRPAGPPFGGHALRRG